MIKIIAVFMMAFFSIPAIAQKIDVQKKSSVCKYDENKVLKGAKFTCLKKINKVVR